MSTDQDVNWICQICQKPAGADGVIEIINVNINLGPIGSYPVMRSEESQEVSERFRAEKARERGISPERFAFSLEDLSDLPLPQCNNDFVVRHVSCTADQANEGYWFATSRAATLDTWAGWMLHLSEKKWMGRDDLTRMLSFWWSHKGKQPPTCM